MERRNGGCNPRLVIGLIVAVISVIGYFSSSSKNAVTGETQHVSMSPDQEIALGLQATPQMVDQYGGQEKNTAAAERVQAIGAKVVRNSDASQTPYEFDFHLLSDRQTINAFALPGGQIFITRALLDRLTTDGQLAGVLGHEVGHVCARHGAEHMAKAQLTQGLTGAAVIATYDPNNPSSRNTAAIAAMVGQLVNLKYGREDELESDDLGVRFMSQAGYDPRSMIEVMKILKQASGNGRQPEFFSTHPNPDNRIEKIQAAIQKRFPTGVPTNLTP
ncbi:MAG: peptidase M48 Ste24p [Armatimonadetes bacterium 55-13]|nr:M48 family metalloprotease [Armatimonadota bacterium]ODU53497.1 MAG: peptidase M48 Ste24p [bacterium SCN 57-13]OJU63936.1 MAG: peptidase M48 Ste24p [Armatimonadetes bacterium 55-13]